MRCSVVSGLCVEGIRRGVENICLTDEARLIASSCTAINRSQVITGVRVWGQLRDDDR